jgi:hypothetical protein
MTSGDSEKGMVTQHRIDVPLNRLIILFILRLAQVQHGGLEFYCIN